MIADATKLGSVALVLLMLTACGSWKSDDILPDKAVEYKREKQAQRNLEVPPDLTSDSINNGMSIPAASGVSASYQDFMVQQRQTDGTRRVGGGQILPDIADIQVQRDGDERWLLISADAETVWPQLIDFWQQNGILLQEQDPTVGIMVTAWIENRADIKNDFITDTIRKVFDGLYEAGSRDQYRIRIERGSEPGVTELYLTHFGMQETLPTNTAGEQDQSVWVPRDRDPGLEQVMLRRVMVFLGQAKERADVQLASHGGQTAPRSQLVKGRAGAQLLVQDNFARAWRLTGLALDRVGFAVEDRNRSTGVYYVRYNDPAARAKEEGWLSKLAFWSSDDDVDKAKRYQVKVIAGDGVTTVTVLDDQGEVDRSPTGERILTLLQEQIR